MVMVFNCYFLLHYVFGLWYVEQSILFNYFFLCLIAFLLFHFMRAYCICFNSPSFCGAFFLFKNALINLNTKISSKTINPYSLLSASATYTFCALNLKKKKTATKAFPASFISFLFY